MGGSNEAAEDHHAEEKKLESHICDRAVVYVDLREACLWMLVAGRSSRSILRAGVDYYMYVVSRASRALDVEVLIYLLI